ncbi:MAG: AzlC family ABC transporter permease [Sphaerochaeta sp.]|jgi:4-azaleucine resistance transporter AzlC|nr:AzlC family ABC transporter permease [Sphaerochaeta sp.]
MARTLTFKQGFHDGLPIFIGYFPTALAFGLVCRDLGLRAWHAILFSVTNFAGSGQFLAASLMGSGALLAELFISVLLINMRYVFMGAELSRKLDPAIRGWQRPFIAFGTTDEVFSVAVLNGEMLTASYLFGLEGTSYLGWVGGTATGFLIGMILPSLLQLAVGVTLYALFTVLLTQQVRQKGVKALAIAALSGGLHTLLSTRLAVPVGWSFVISMLTATFVGAALIDEEAGL